ncbi:MAG: porin family protein [Prolixibacteraceae bacterium]
MKRLRDFCLVMLIAFLLFPANLFAQDQGTQPEATKKKPSFWFGPKIGLDLATATLDQSKISSQFKSNAQLGVFFQFGRILYLQPEFYYAMHKETNTTLSLGSQSTTKVNTLKVPVLIGLRLINLGIVSAHVMAGPQGTFFLSESNPLSTFKRQSKAYNFQLGAGADILGFITVDVRYSLGLDNTLGTQIQGLDLKSGVNATVGLKFR